MSNKKNSISNNNINNKKIGKISSLDYRKSVKSNGANARTSGVSMQNKHIKEGFDNFLKTKMDDYLDNKNSKISNKDNNSVDIQIDNIPDVQKPDERKSSQISSIPLKNLKLKDKCLLNRQNTLGINISAPKNIIQNKFVVLESRIISKNKKPKEEIEIPSDLLYYF